MDWIGEGNRVEYSSVVMDLGGAAEELWLRLPRRKGQELTPNRERESGS